jgi:hypothetical protein
MNSLDRNLALLLLTILFYKALDLWVAGLKIRQATRRGKQVIRGSRAFRRFRIFIRKLEVNFAIVGMCFFFLIIIVVGFAFLLSNSTTGDGHQPFLTSFVLSIGAAISSIFVSSLNVLVEKYRDLIELQT